MHPSHMVTKTSDKTDAVAAIVWDFVRWAWLNYRRWRHCRATVRTLRALDARMLKDIGLDASEIESIAYSSSADRRHRYRPFDRPEI